MTDRGMVVTPQPEATEAGRDILAAGGNAIDAAIATALVQTVVDPLMCGIAGFGSLAVYLPSKGVHTYYDFHSPAPGAVRPNMWECLIEGEARDGYGFILKGNVNDVGYQSICVPASLKAYAEAHGDHGKLPWAELFGPAIAYAEGGWNVRPHVHTFWTEEGMMGRVGNAERIAFTPAARELYCRSDGSPKRVGDGVTNRDYGAVLRAISKAGAEVFYQGEIADAIDADMQAHGGLLRRSDLETYRIVRNAPLASRPQFPRHEQSATWRRHHVARDARRTRKFRSAVIGSQQHRVYSSRRRGHEGCDARQGPLHWRSVLRGRPDRTADFEGSLR